MPASARRASSVVFRAFATDSLAAASQLLADVQRFGLQMVEFRMTVDAEGGAAIDFDIDVAPCRDPAVLRSILLMSEVEMRDLMGSGFMFQSLLRLGRSRQTRSHSSANRVHRDWPLRDEASSRRGWESRACRAPTASLGRPG